MKPVFYRPLLILFGALLLLGFAAPWIPAFDNAVFPIKQFNWLRDILSGKNTAVDEVAMADTLEIDGTLVPLDGFAAALAKLKETRQGRLRIAYFGDSIIEGDLLTGRLRHELQLEYGGSGVGLVPITSIVNEFRKTIRHSFSKNWETLSFMTPGNSTGLGMIGYTFIPRNYQIIESQPLAKAPAKADTTVADSISTYKEPPVKAQRRVHVAGPAWVEYTAANVRGGSVDFRRIRLFYSNARGTSAIRVIRDADPAQSVALQAGEGVQVLELGKGSPITRLRLEFDPADPIHVYGVSFDDTAGVYVDNLSVRGYSGMFFHKIPSDILSAFQRHLRYDLVVLQYGENVSRPEVRDYSFFKRGMINSIRHINAALPGVPVLVVSAHDRSVKQNGSYVTSPDIPYLVNTQAELARETGAAFWNMYLAMGGANSMPNLVNAVPPLASRDYTHFTLAGADKIALLLKDVLLQGSKAERK